MMEKTTLKAAITYESKLVKRNWLFYLFIFGVFIYTFRLTFIGYLPIRIHQLEKICICILLFFIRDSLFKLVPIDNCRFYRLRYP